MKCLPSICAVFLLWAGSAWSRTLEVGPGLPYQLPSQAIAAAQDGDIIAIRPGQYFDCAVIRQNGLTIQGTGPGAVLTDKTCQGKALLVIDSSDVTVRNLTLERARVPDQNGAGIRAEGGHLTVENTRFLNNENGILSAPNPSAVIKIIGSEFIGNGKCETSCAHAVYIGDARLLHIEHSRFRDTHVGHQIKSQALRTEIINNDIEDGPEGSSSYLVDIPNGGEVIITGNRMEKGPHASNQAYAITIGEDGVNRPTDRLIIKDNTFINDQERPTTFVRNLTATPAELSGNIFKGQVRPLEGDGSSG
jgi:nitrous oxidase accessory protein NosD